MVDPLTASFDRSTALVIVDVQNDFADPGGNLYVPGGDDAVAFVNGEILRAARGGAFVVYTQDWHPETTPHFEKDGGVWPVHCVAGTWGAELHPGLVVDGPTIKKGTGGEDGYSGFTMRDSSGAEHSTGLEAALRDRGVTKVVIAGLATDYCVKETALDAASKGFATMVVRDGVRAVDLAPDDGERALDEMQRRGVAVV